MTFIKKYKPFICITVSFLILSMMIGCSPVQGGRQPGKQGKFVGMYQVHFNASRKQLSVKSIDVTSPNAGENLNGKAGLFQIGSVTFDGSLITGTVYIVNNDSVSWTGVEMQAYSMISGTATAADTDLGTGWYKDHPLNGAWGWIFTSGTAGSPFTIPAGGQSANKVFGFYATADFDAQVYIYADVPIITGITNGTEGSPVTISGYNFSSAPGSVSFSGSTGTVISWADTSLVATVPTGSGYGNVVADTGDPNTPYSNPFAFPALLPPANLTATAGNKRVTLRWSASLGATSYTIYYSTTSGGPYSKAGTSINANYSVTGLMNGTVYYFVVIAMNIVQASDYSNQTSATPQLITKTYPAGNRPLGIAIDSSDNVWVTNFGSNYIIELSSGGTTIGTYPVGLEPWGIAIDSSGNVWVANEGSNSITKLSSGGKTIGTYLAGSSPIGTVIDSSGNVWVADWGSTTITKLSPDGTTIGTYPAGSSPVGTVIDSSGNVWVADWGSTTVTKLSPDGTTMGTYSAGNRPVSIAIDRLGNAWIANEGSNTITELSPDGTTIDTYPVGSNPNGIAIDNAGNVWVANKGSDTVTELLGMTAGPQYWPYSGPQWP